MTNTERYQKYKIRQAKYHQKHRDKYRLYGYEQYRKVKAKVAKTCIDCGIIICPQSKERCRACNYLYHVGEKSSVYKGGRSAINHPKHKQYRKELHLKEKCVDCGKPVTETAKRCRPCMYKYIRANRNMQENETVRKSIEYRLWREAIFARDGFTCQECKIKGTEMHAHHIKPFSKYPELRLAIDNGITLCKICHRNTGLHTGLWKDNKNE